MRASLRHGMTPTELEQQLAGKGGGAAAEHRREAPGKASPGKPATSGKPLTVLYGSNSGTCEVLAQRLAADAPRHGFRAIVASLDAANQDVPKDRPVIVIASYEGQPPSNAALFVAWVAGLKGSEMQGVSYAVFGCGHHDWVQTFQRIPKLVDSKLHELGGTRIVPLATTDAADRDTFSDFETWEDESLWPALQQKYGTKDTGDSSDGLQVEFSLPHKTTLRQDVEEAHVVSARTLTEHGSVKKHIEIQLPTGMTYRAGDYLAVLPLNPKQIVSRVFRRFKLSWDTMLKITSDRPTTLPTDTAVSAADVLSAYVELSQPATKRNAQALAEATEDQAAVQELRKLAGDDYHDKVTPKRVSILDLLERFPSIDLPFSSYLGMLPPLRVRQYSISSSPLADASTLTLTYSVLERPALSGQGPHVGVVTSFLSSLGPGDRLHVAVRRSESFHLPGDVEKTPLLCVAVGSGIAPFRGFIQERAAMMGAGRKAAPALLFFGCRSPDDDLYADELAQWEAQGAVEVRLAYSRASDQSAGCRHVQDRLWHDRADVCDLWDRGARIYVCGSGDVGKAVEAACVKMVQDSVKAKRGKDMTEAAARERFEQHRNERYVTDVFD